MATLSDEVKEFIVNSLACYDTPSQVAEAVRVTFGIEITRQQVFSYDPDGSRPPASRWKELHWATRHAYLRKVAEIGIAQKTVRLAMLERMVRNAMAHGNNINAAAYLAQAAKECGGIYENRRPIVVLPVQEPASAHPALPPDGTNGVIESMPLRRLSEPIRS